MKFFGKFLIALGIIFVVFGAYLSWQRVNPKRVSFYNNEILAKSTNSKNLKSEPVSLSISSVEINLPIIESKIENYKWQVTDKGVSRIENVYYGHNYPNLLGKLTKVKPGDMIEIKNTDNSVIKYKVETTQEVDPSQKDILNLATDKKILIYTCSGFLDSKRFVVVASEIFGRNI